MTTDDKIRDEKLQMILTKSNKDISTITPIITIIKEILPFTNSTIVEE